MADVLIAYATREGQTGNPTRVELIAGALKYTQYNPLVRFIMRRIAATAGGDLDTSRDYEYTDWAAVDRFVIEFVHRSDESRRAAG